jgi:hypothetical protein
LAHTYSACQCNIAWAGGSLIAGTFAINKRKPLPTWGTCPTDNGSRRTPTVVEPATKHIRAVTEPRANVFPLRAASKDASTTASTDGFQWAGRAVDTATTDATNAELGAAAQHASISWPAATYADEPRPVSNGGKSGEYKAE